MSSRRRVAAVLVILALGGCSSSAARGAADPSTSVPRKPVPSVIAEVASFRQRGTAATDHVFDQCHAAVTATPKPTNPDALPACSTKVIAAEITTARGAASALSLRLAGFRSPTVAAATVHDTVTTLDALVAAFGAWERCALRLPSQIYFASDTCKEQTREADEARTDMIALAQRWPES